MVRHGAAWCGAGWRRQESVVARTGRGVVRRAVGGGKGGWPRGLQHAF